MGYVAREGLKKIIVPLLKKATEKNRNETFNGMSCAFHTTSPLPTACCLLSGSSIYLPACAP